MNKELLIVDDDNPFSTDMPSTSPEQAFGSNMNDDENDVPF